jgi:hypothetical protein
MKKILLIAAIFLVIAGIAFQSNLKNWDQEAQELAASEDWIACHFEDGAGESKPRHDGFQCREAQCVIDGKIMFQGALVDQHVAISRGICQESGTVCSEASRKPCAPNEVCILMEEGENAGQDVQAICADD